MLMAVVQIAGATTKMLLSLSLKRIGSLALAEQRSLGAMLFGD
jgi:hypothetical protein